MQIKELLLHAVVVEVGAAVSLGFLGKRGRGGYGLSPFRLIEVEAGPPELSSRVCRLKEEGRQLKCQRKNQK